MALGIPIQLVLASLTQAVVQEVPTAPRMVALVAEAGVVVSTGHLWREPPTWVVEEAGVEGHTRGQVQMAERGLLVDREL